MLEGLGVAPVFDDVVLAQKRCLAALFTGLRRVEEMILEWECAEAASKCSVELSAVKKRLDVLFLDLDKSVIFERNGLLEKPKLDFSWEQFQGYHTTMMGILIDLDEMRGQIPGMQDWARCYDEEMTNGQQQGLESTKSHLDSNVNLSDMMLVDYDKFGRHVLSLKRALAELRTIVSAQNVFAHREGCLYSQKPSSLLALSERKCPRVRTKDGLDAFTSNSQREAECCLANLRPKTPQGSILYWLLTSNTWRSSDLLNQDFLEGIVADWLAVVLKMSEAGSIHELQEKPAIQQRGMAAAGYGYTKVPSSQNQGRPGTAHSL